MYAFGFLDLGLRRLWYLGSIYMYLARYYMIYASPDAVHAIDVVCVRLSELFRLVSCRTSLCQHKIRNQSINRAEQPAAFSRTAVSNLTQSCPPRKALWQMATAASTLREKYISARLIVTMTTMMRVARRLQRIFWSRILVVPEVSFYFEHIFLGRLNQRSKTPVSEPSQLTPLLEVRSSRVATSRLPPASP